MILALSASPENGSIERFRECIRSASQPHIQYVYVTNATAIPI